MDTEPLRPPQNWIGLSDLSAWVDPVSGEKHGLDIKQAVSSSKSPPVSLIGGVEADLDPDTDTYWRMGYSYPVQLTQWALASAPQHHVLESFMTQLRTLANDAVADAKKSGKKLTSLEKAYAVERTGPVAFTNAVRSYLEMKVGLRWNSLTGREDNGKVKLVADVLILPITGFRYVVLALQCRIYTDECAVLAGKRSWVRSLSMMLKQDSTITSSDHGVTSMLQPNRGSYAARCSGCAKTGPWLILE
jgi:hypothetical protein